MEAGRGPENEWFAGSVVPWAKHGILPDLSDSFLLVQAKEAISFMALA